MFLYSKILIMENSINRFLNSKLYSKLIMQYFNKLILINSFI